MSFQFETGANYVFTSEEKVSLTFPADPRYFLLARMSTSALASQLSFGIDEVEELRLAIDELLSSCIVGAEKDACVELTFSLSSDELGIVCTVAPIAAMSEADGGDIGQLTQELLAERILDALTDAHGTELVTPTTRRGWIRRARNERS